MVTWCGRFRGTTSRQHSCTTIAKSSTISETELIAGLKARRKEVFEYLYDRYSAALFGVVYRVIPDSSTAEEVLHDAFLRIWDRIGSYDPQKGRLFTWMLNVTRNLAIDKTRSREITTSRKTASLEKLVSSVDEGSTSQPEDVIGLREVLNSLEPEQREVVEYLYLKGYTQSEMAEESGIPLGTIKTRVRLAMNHLRTLLRVA